jgi:hypothetical protein
VTIVADVFSHDQFIPVSISEPFSFRVHHNLRTNLNLWGLRLCLKLHVFMYSRNPRIWTLVIQIGLALRVNLSRILQNELALKVPVIRSSTVHCYGFENFKSGLQGLDTGTVHTVNRKSWNSNCHCSLFSKTNPIIQIFCVSGWLAIPVNPDMWSTTVL